MAFIQFKSDNPDFSYLLMKNPESGMTLRRYRQGTLFGYYTKGNLQEYNVYFKDGDDEISFKKNQDEQYEHNDYKRYNSPMFIQGVVNDFLRQHTNGDNIMEQDKIGFNYKVVVNQFHVYDPKYLDLIAKYFNKFKIEYVLLNKSNYRVTFETNQETFKGLVNIIYIAAMFYHCTDKDVWIDEAEIERYVRILNNLDAPYFLKYVVKYRVIKSQNKFKHVKSELEKTTKNTFEMYYGDTHYQRAEFIKDLMGEDSEQIVDIGCNTMSSYGFNLLKKLSKNSVYYHAIDIDEEVLKKVVRKAELNGYDNLITYSSIDDFLDTENKEGVNIIMSEVFEHIQLKEDTKIITNCLKHLNINKMIITTPDRDFNVNYLFDEDDKRLDDHVFEMTSNEFINYFDKLMKPFVSKYNYEFIKIGDKVNGISASQAIVIKRK